MWTPRRVVLLGGCFAAFFVAYAVYAFSYVGRIDGLPPLPQVMWPDPSAGPLVIPPRAESRLEGKLKLAFGEGCKELKWAIRLDVSKKNLVLAAEQFQLTPDGRVCLAPLSIALFGKEVRGQGPEINTLKSEVAYLKFDRPVISFAEIGNRKIVEAELTGRVELVNNRRRTERDQDLRVEAQTGPLYYHEPSHRIRTDDFVALTDHKSKPPHVLKGKGLEMELATEAAPANKKKNAQAVDTITGVKWAELKSDVHLTLHTDGRSANLVGKPGEKSNGPPERARLEVKTAGKFRYELYKDHDLATFEAGTVPPGQVARMPLQVEARRENLTTKKNDFLVCHKLALRLRRRENKKQAKADSSPEAVDIETVRATAPGNNVVLTSDAEALKARGSDFFHDAPRGRTILKSSEGVHVVHKDTDIRAVELDIQEIKPPAAPGQPPPRPYQIVRAVGPGRILAFDAREKKTLRAEWQKLLTSNRENGQDILTLTGAAEFNDPVSNQALRGDVLKVWMEEVATPVAAAGKASPTSGRRPRHLEATGRVSASSKEININDANRLVVWFRDVPAASALPKGGDKPAGGAASSVATKPGEIKAPPARAPVTGPTLGGPASDKEARPFDLSARSVEVWVHRLPAASPLVKGGPSLSSGQKNQIDKLECLGAVRVSQKPAVHQARGTEIKGDSLKMTSKSEGLYHLAVTGDLGELQTDTLYIAGPEVHIDQATNVAWVVGDGVMTMESKTNWQGEELAKSVPLTVHWSKSMLFDGESAEFLGNIQAEQDRGRLGCQRLQVYFDQPISLRRVGAAQEKKAPARVRTMVCDRDVRIEEAQYEGTKLTRYQRLEGPQVQMIALEPEDGAPAKGNNGNSVSASGPGNIRVFDAGGADALLAPGPKAPARKPADGKASAAKPAPAKKLTCIYFGKRMDGNSKTGKAIFYENVRVIHLPSERHDQAIDLDALLADELPEGSLYLKCDKLEVLDRKVNGQPSKEMEAKGKVRVEGREFSGRAEQIKYNQAKQQVVLEGGAGGNATLSKIDAPGGRPKTIVARKIIYHRATGRIDVEGVDSLTGQSAPPAPGKKK